MSNPDAWHDDLHKARDDKDENDRWEGLDEERVEGAHEVGVDGEAEQSQAYLGEDDWAQGVVGKLAAADDLISNPEMNLRL